MGQTPNNFTILNRDYNTQYNLSKEKTHFFFSLTAFFLTVYLSQFSLTLYFSLLFCFCLLSLAQFFKTVPILTLWNFTLLHSSQNGRMALLYISSSFSSFLPSTCLTSLTSHLHLCGLTFVHPFINVAGLLYPILLFWPSYSSKPISFC